MTLMGWGIAIVLGVLSFDNMVPEASLGIICLGLAFVIGMSSFVVIYATRGRHPGWIVLLVIVGLLLAVAL